MAQLWSTGPVHIHAKLGPTGQKVMKYLGTGQQAPDINIEGHHVPVMNDIGGPVLPFDQIWAGEIGRVDVEFTRWNETNLALLAARPSQGSNGVPAVRGKNTRYDIGSLLLTEDLAFELYLQFVFSVGQTAPKPAFNNAASGQQPAGYHFLRAIVDGPMIRRPGTKANSMHVSFFCLRYYIATSGALGTAGDFLLYDHTLPALSLE